eukprot:CAMPEP_0115475676 /NCGR_PEP_ID=MMETSP0271-20121206/54739_1 /TAXON_ID=71861 /ORGANISM="Scrippsiella trochoidea, Strain CCMP3099" /LENGTH=374 /DNA_ID=CAMNT_0002903055 /DNA_START=21 /DNA_END=1143 /DNA_ORIENTATION=+
MAGCRSSKLRVPKFVSIFPAALAAGLAAQAFSLTKAQAAANPGPAPEASGSRSPARRCSWRRKPQLEGDTLQVEIAVPKMPDPLDASGCGCPSCRRGLLLGLGAGLAAAAATTVLQGPTGGGATGRWAARWPDWYLAGFVRQMKEGMADFERWMVPRKTALFSRGLQGLGQSSASGLGGPKVVELGIGAGTNLPFFRSAGLKRAIAVEPNPEFAQPALEKAKREGIKLEVHEGVAENLSVFPDNSVDAVVATMVLCSVDSQEAALREVHRILRPGGRYIFMEHTLAEGPEQWGLRGLQVILDPLQQLVSAGCRLNNRPMPTILKTFGADGQVEADHFSADSGKQRIAGPFGIEAPQPHFLLAPHVAGIATKSST